MAHTLKPVSPRLYLDDDGNPRPPTPQENERDAGHPDPADYSFGIPRDMSYADAMKPGSGFSYSEPIRSVCTCGRKTCAGACTHAGTRRGDARLDFGNR